MSRLVRIENSSIASAEAASLQLWRGYDDAIHRQLARLSRAPGIAPDYPDDKKIFQAPDHDRRWQDPSLRVMYTLGTAASREIVLASWYTRTIDDEGRRGEWTRHERKYPYTGLSNAMARSAIEAAHRDFQSYTNIDILIATMPVESSNI